jgi:hypothetical protein
MDQTELTTLANEGAILCIDKMRIAFVMQLVFVMCFQTRQREYLNSTSTRIYYNLVQTIYSTEFTRDLFTQNFFTFIINNGYCFYHDCFSNIIIKVQ